ncbi:TaqI-like C-terminal specificity domain-containing protein [Riemerella anatipestifer]|uniref:TaqI-like C-terminal specificity domain-containing protein n=1 Tax=Riemerella anatipestifer TaxID=34085 RepID=UPI0030EEBA0D
MTEFTNSESWVVLSPIEKQIKEKIERIGTPLKDWDIRINYGIKTGFNEAFIIDGAKRKELIDEDPKSEEIIRPILRGRDIKRYGYDFADLWLINTHNGVKEKGIKCINTEDYPAIKKHLDQYYPQLEKRADKGDTPYNLRNCAYMEDFSKQKIMYPNMTKFLPFYLDDKGFMQNDKSFMITGKHVAFLTAFLNSSIFKYCFIDNFPELQGGTRELRKIFLDKIPILEITDKTNKEFEKLVLKLQDLIVKQKQTKEIELEIDNKIFDLYSLNQEERNIIGFIEIQ